MALAREELQSEKPISASRLGIRALNTAYTPQADATLFAALSENRVVVALAGKSTAYSPDGRFIVTASIWDVDYRDFVTYACERVGKVRDFTDEERRQFGITDDAPTCP